MTKKYQLIDNDKYVITKELNFNEKIDLNEYTPREKEILKGFIGKNCSAHCSYNTTDTDKYGNITSSDILQKVLDKEKIKFNYNGICELQREVMDNKKKNNNK